MPLINLKLIAELAQHNHHYKYIFDGWMLGWEERESTVTDTMVVNAVRLTKQADNLFEGLKRLHQTCFDLAANNLLPYQQEHERFAEDEEPYDPFDTLLFRFDSESVRDLPDKIEQYSELHYQVSVYPALKQAEREGFDKFFGPMKKYYSATDAAGQPVMVPQDQLPDGYVEQFDASEAIDDINVEYCLDQYNTFFRTCLQTIDNYRPSGDIVHCAQVILDLFVPYPASLTPTKNE